MSQGFEVCVAGLSTLHVIFVCGRPATVYDELETVLLCWEEGRMRRAPRALTTRDPNVRDGDPDLRCAPSRCVEANCVSQLLRARESPQQGWTTIRLGRDGVVANASVVNYRSSVPERSQNEFTGWIEFYLLYLGNRPTALPFCV